jgi:hypothetical protein
MMQIQQRYPSNIKIKKSHALECTGIVLKRDNGWLADGDGGDDGGGSVYLRFCPTPKGFINKRDVQQGS